MRALLVASCLVACASPTEPAHPPQSQPDAPPVVEPAPTVVVAEPGPAEASEPEAAPTAAEPRPEAAPESAPAPPSAAASARDPRIGATRFRPRTLLVSELQALERLYQATPKSSPDRPLLMRRLAEGYVELEYSADNDADKKVALAARKNALKYYLAVRAEYPAFPKLDEVLYYAGYEHERGGDLAQARALYRELDQKFPGSPFRARVPAKLRGP